MLSFEQQLILINSYAKKYINNIDVNQINPIEYTNNDESITIVDPTLDAFNLKPPVAGNLKSISVQRTLPNAACTRMLLGYGALNNLANNEYLFNFQFSHMLNACLATLKRNLGDLKDREITLFLPSNGEVFFDNSNCAAVEFRIFVKGDK